ncbi:hypothetical protein J2Y58_000537 [Sphingomonas sp. BE138]|uniref:hypothetical protein n=1 Tax=Sphingomonas sp. BE138 TaxID=2817845 RepID=UPI0028672DB0|nr:hypothetical protein [Sphingomonas sp. BE138]MDR6787199.1 hypothetical protein [Sphingomonas sp. BE138]
MRGARGKRIERAWATLQAAADLAAARGSLLFHLDLATEVARGALAAHGIADTRVAATADAFGYQVFTLGDGASAPVLAAARFDAAGRARIDLHPGPPPPRAAAFADARATIAAATAARAVVVVPASDPDRPIEGYALAIADVPDQAMLGGHWLLRLTPSGKQIMSRTPLSAGTGGVAVAALREAALTTPDAVPHELHVYLSLKHDVPFVVAAAASGLRWRVDGERLTPLRG